MMNYRVSKSESGNFVILEKDSSKVIEAPETVKSEAEIRKMCRRMNLGSGFNGWTPDFFTKRPGSWLTKSTS